MMRPLQKRFAVREDRRGYRLECAQKLKSSGLAALLGVTMLFLVPEGLARSPTPTANGRLDADYAKTPWEQIRESGWALVPIGLCFAAGLYVLASGMRSVSRARTAPAGPEQTIKALFRQGDYVSANSYCGDNPSPLTNVLGAGISSLRDGGQATQEAVRQALGEEKRQTQIWTRHLLMIAVCAPLIGLLGSITGLMKVGLRVGGSAISDYPGLLADIGGTLVALAFGLAVAILALAGFHLLRHRAAASVSHLQEVVKSIFTKMPYGSLADVHLGDDQSHAAPLKSPVQAHDGIKTERGPTAGAPVDRSKPRTTGSR